MKAEIIEQGKKRLYEYKSILIADGSFDGWRINRKWGSGLDVVQDGTAISIMLKKPLKELCYECGRSVVGGSGRFVNRIPSLDSYEERVEMGVPYPQGEWLCDECDQKAQQGIES